MTTVTTELPLSMDALRQVITQPDAGVVVDYNNSNLKGRAALIYMTNTNLPNVALNMTDVSLEEKFVLVDDYITHKSILHVAQLVNTVLNVLFAVRKVDIGAEQDILDQVSLFPQEHVGEYLANPTRAEHINKLIELLDSLPLYAVTCSTSFREVYGKGKEAFEPVNDIDHTGFTFVHLLTHPLFLEYFTQPATTTLKYYVQQFDEYMYNGKSLFPFLVNSPVFGILECYITGAVDLDQLLTAHSEMNALEGAAA